MPSTIYRQLAAESHDALHNHFAQVELIIKK
jgi:hypothetical protein